MISDGVMEEDLRDDMDKVEGEETVTRKPLDDTQEGGREAGCQSET